MSILGIARTADDATGRGDRSARFDPFGLVLLAVGLALTTYGATLGAQDGWTASHVWPYWTSGCVLLVAYLVWALIARHPALDLKLLRRGQSLLAITVSSVASVVMFAMLVLIPVFMQDLQGNSTLSAGLTLLPQGIAMGLSTLLGMWAANRWGVRLTVVAGMLVLGLTTALLLTLQLDTPGWVIAALLSGRGLALGLTVQPLLLALTGGLASTELADGNTLFNVFERLSGSVGIALLATLLQQREQARIADVLAALHLSINLSAATSTNLPPAVRTQLADAAIQGFHDTILALVALSLAGALLALLLRNERVSDGPDAVARGESVEAPSAVTSAV